MQRKTNLPQLKHGFTLIELLIVIVIIGLVASVAMARLGREKQQANETALRLNLRQVRLAIQRFALLHNGVFPAKTSDGTFESGTEECFVRQLTLRTTSDGTVSDDYHSVGPYLTGQIPHSTVRPIRGNTTVSVVAEPGRLSPSGGSTYAWKYNARTGEFICNSRAVGLDGKEYWKW